MYRMVPLGREAMAVSRRTVTTSLMVGACAAAWLRFDVGSLIMSWSLAVLCIVAAVAAEMLRARRLPANLLPPDVQELGARDELTDEEEVRFADALRAWHRRGQFEVWRQFEREGPGPRIMTRAAFYFLWLCLVALVVLPRAAVPAMLPRLPRFVVVLLPLAAAALAVAVPLGIRDWKRAREALASE